MHRIRAKTSQHAILFRIRWKVSTNIQALKQQFIQFAGFTGL